MIELTYLDGYLWFRRGRSGCVVEKIWSVLVLGTRHSGLVLTSDVHVRKD